MLHHYYLKNDFINCIHLLWNEKKKIFKNIIKIKFKFFLFIPLKQYIVKWLLKSEFRNLLIILA